MPFNARVGAVCAALLLCASALPAARASQKPQPDAQFGNWLYKTPDPKIWSRSEKEGNLIFSTNEPAGDFCTLTLFAGAPAQDDFTAQFSTAVAEDQKAKGTVRIEADSGAKPGKSAEGFDVLTRSIRAETNALHTLHTYIAGHSGDRFDLAAFQTSSEESWQQYGAQAAQFLLSLKLANSLPPAEVNRLLGRTTEPPPTLPGLDEAMAPAAAAPAADVAHDAAKPPEAMAPAGRDIPDVPLAKSSIVVNNVVTRKNGQPIDGVKLSQHDMEIYSPSIAVDRHGVIHVAFVEKHRTTYALAAYYRSSADGGKTWTPAKNLSEDMPNIAVGLCYVLVDGQDRVYVIWRAGLAQYFSASPDPGRSSQSNVVYRVLVNGQWSKILPVNPPGSKQTQDDGALSYFAAVDAAGHVRVLWNSIPDKWHPELTHISGSYHQHLPGVGPGLVFQATLDGTAATQPHEVFLSPVGGNDKPNGYGAYCDGLDTLNGYIDADGAAHFLAGVTRTRDESLKGKSWYELIENGKVGPMLDLPELSFHAWRDIPRLLVDAAGRRHVIALFNAGEHPSIRDYLIGSDEEPTVIRETAGTTGTVIGFQAYQGPGGRMVAIMEMNDSGDRGSGDTYISTSTGQGWSTPVNVTNNAGRKSFASKQTSRASNIAIEKSYEPGVAAAAFDPEGHLLVLMINNENSLFSQAAFGVELAGGSSTTPTLRFLKF